MVTMPGLTEILITVAYFSKRWGKRIVAKCRWDCVAIVPRWHDGVWALWELCLFLTVPSFHLHACSFIFEDTQNDNSWHRELSVNRSSLEFWMTGTLSFTHWSIISCGNTQPESYHCTLAEKIGQEHLFKTCIERECSHVKWQNKSTQIHLKAQNVLRFCLHSLWTIYVISLFFPLVPLRDTGKFNSNSKYADICNNKHCSSYLQWSACHSRSVKSGW